MSEEDTENPNKLPDNPKRQENFLRLIETVKKRKGKVVILIGAGCSKSAGIPLANEIVTDVQKLFPIKASLAKEQTYPHVMGELELGERKEIIDNYILKSKINWAHIAISQLLKCNNITKVMTTNFDPLVVKACAINGIFPAVYDLASSTDIMKNSLPDRSVFYLHGQQHAAKTLHTDDETKMVNKFINPLVANFKEEYTFIVVGYSGKNDPVFNNICNKKVFSFGIYWVGFEDNPVEEHVNKKLLYSNKHKKNSYFLEGFNADTFFIELAKELNCFPPSYLAKPFSQVKDTINLISDKFPSFLGKTDDLTKQTLIIINEAIEKIEAESSNIFNKNLSFLNAEGKTKQIINLIPQTGEEISNLSIRDREIMVWALLEENTKNIDTNNYINYFEKIDSNFKLAEIILPGFVPISINWSFFLNKASSHFERNKSLKMLERALELAQYGNAKYSNNEKILTMIGSIYGRTAFLKTGDEKIKLINIAIENFEKAVSLGLIDPDTYYNLGLNYGKLFDLSSKTEIFIQKSATNFEKLINISPKYENAHNYLGVAYLRLAQIKNNDPKLIRKSFEQYEQENKNYPNNADYNIGSTYSIQKIFDKSKMFLDSSYQKKKFPNKNFLLKDKDFIPLREHDPEWWQNFIDSLPDD
jgi:hypothetical protein